MLELSVENLVISVLHYSSSGQYGAPTTSEYKEYVPPVIDDDDSSKTIEKPSDPEEKSEESERVISDKGTRLFNILLLFLRFI